MQRMQFSGKPFLCMLYPAFFLLLYIYIYQHVPNGTVPHQLVFLKQRSGATSVEHRDLITTLKFSHVVNACLLKHTGFLLKAMSVAF